MPHTAILDELEEAFLRQEAQQVVVVLTTQRADYENMLAAKLPEDLMGLHQRRIWNHAHDCCVDPPLQVSLIKDFMWPVRAILRELIDAILEVLAADVTDKSVTINDWETTKCREALPGWSQW